MIQAPFDEYVYEGRKRVGATGSVGQWLTWPTTGSVFVYSDAGPQAQALGGYTAGNGTGTIGQIIGLSSDANGGQWYVVDTTAGSLPAATSWPGASNTVYIPAFGDSSQPDSTQLTAAQQQASGANLNFQASNTASGNGTGNGGSGGGTGTGTGNGLLPGSGAGVGGLTIGDWVVLGIFGFIVLGIGINQATK